MTGRASAGDSGAAASARSTFTALAVGVLAVFGYYCALVGAFVWSDSGEPGTRTAEVVGPVAGLLLVMAIAVGALVAQLRWANRAQRAATIVRRSLLVLAGPGAVVLFFALAAAL
ncbi:MAG: hypothetical protein ACRDT0_18935 [Pseudonocardiaceae bacterium]